MGKLLNADKTEPIDDKLLYKDWLVFEVKNNHSNLAILELRDTPLEPGELLTAYGCTYENQKTCSQDEYQGKFIETEGSHIRVTKPYPDLTYGLSGSPVLDKQNKVVGIVSTIFQSKSGKGLDFAPASSGYLKEVLNKLTG